MTGEPRDPIGDVEVHRIEEPVIWAPTTPFPDFRRDGLIDNIRLAGAELL